MTTIGKAVISDLMMMTRWVRDISSRAPKIWYCEENKEVSRENQLHLGHILDRIYPTTQQAFTHAIKIFPSMCLIEHLSCHQHLLLTSTNIIPVWLQNWVNTFMEKCFWTSLVVTGHNGHKPKRPQTEMATNRKGHKPKRPQTGTAINRNGNRQKRPQTKMATNRNGHKLESPQSETTTGQNTLTIIEAPQVIID